MDGEWFVHTIYAWLVETAQDQESRDKIDEQLLEDSGPANTKRERARKFRELMSS